MKCLKCAEEFNGNIALGRHYKEHPSHRPKYRGTVRPVTKMLPTNSAIAEILKDPTILTHQIGELLSHNDDLIAKAQKEIAELEAQNKRLRGLRNAFSNSQIHPIASGE